MSPIIKTTVQHARFQGNASSRMYTHARARKCGSECIVIHFQIRWFFSRPTADRRKREATLLHCWLTFRWQVSGDAPKENRNFLLLIVSGPDRRRICARHRLCVIWAPGLAGEGHLFPGVFPVRRSVYLWPAAKKIKNCSECVGLLGEREELETFKGLFQVIFLFFAFGFGNHL